MEKRFKINVFSNQELSDALWWLKPDLHIYSFK